MTARYVMSVAETAEALGVSERLVYELIGRGDLPAIELGRRRVVPIRAVELVIERALDRFDPTAVLSGLASADPARSLDGDEHGAYVVGGRAGTTGPEAGAHLAAATNTVAPIAPSPR